MSILLRPPGLLIPAIIITPARPQTATPAHPSFAVATVKPHDPDSRRQGFSAQGDRFTIHSQTVASLLLYAYSIHPRQIVDAPQWALNDRYDIDGKTDTGSEPNLSQQQEMIRKLLADRYDIKIVCAPDELRTADTNTGSGIFTAVEEQLGLKLDPVKAPCDVFVIDGVERPSAN